MVYSSFERENPAEARCCMHCGAPVARRCAEQGLETQHLKDASALLRELGK